MNLLEAALLGIVEGLTEFLPISSTGHLILTSEALGLRERSGAFEVVIQSGAIAAVIWNYRLLFGQSLLGLLAGKASAWRFWIQLMIGFFPAVVLGLLLGDWIKSTLFGVLPVAAALIMGGIVMIVVERRHPIRRYSIRPDNSNSSQELPMLESFQQALFVGLCQCLALWPGTSRSMATILGGRLLGLSPKKAAEFSFWLAIPTLLGASAYDAFKHRDQLFQSTEQISALCVGMLLSFASGLLVIRMFIHFLQKHSLEVFGWYRIVFGLIVLMFALKIF